MPTDGGSVPVKPGRRQRKAPEQPPGMGAGFPNVPVGARRAKRLRARLPRLDRPTGLTYCRLRRAQTETGLRQTGACQKGGED
jgi:hypothetical protein